MRKPKRPRVQTKCNECGISISITQSLFERYKRHYCSMQCSNIQRSSNRKKPDQIIKCKNCGNNFIKKGRHASEPRVYCSNQCRMKGRFIKGLEKNCLVCKKIFRPHPRKNPNHGVVCSIECAWKKLTLEFNKRERKDYRRNQRKNLLKDKFNISLDEYKEMFIKQDGKCAICYTTVPGHKKINFAVDHCHKTNKVRGLLCFRCNLGIGYFKDDVYLLNNCIEYLKRCS